ncbi:hypothetical protein ACFQ48_16000 [Hymenobacter caeli]|uniref:Uncharacterized membrane-anchored protein YhcB (DUF1043 family) n=1 Tax=Hymenobacter caeli TaxID=2735894 RepID=A0ABX2FTR5_9BACT|nr:hypothetical protein [Hymenobacter caeli]NRT20592.1 uncharacterized membrane-anchored protein YhcB (DUF1043 family) [Hymenobacter caeli]
MADQNQELPLVVSEILIEMHELRGGIKQLQTVTVHLSHSVEKLEVEMREVKGVIGQLASSMNTLAGSVKALTEESRNSTEMLIAAFREEGLYVRQLLQQHDARITRLENN